METIERGLRGWIRGRRARLRPPVLAKLTVAAFGTWLMMIVVPALFSAIVGLLILLVPFPYALAWYLGGLRIVTTTAFDIAAGQIALYAVVFPAVILAGPSGYWAQQLLLPAVGLVAGLLLPPWESVDGSGQVAGAFAGCIAGAAFAVQVRDLWSGPMPVRIDAPAGSQAGH